MPSYILRLRTAAQCGSQIQFFRQEAGAHVVLESLFGKRKLKLGFFYSTVTITNSSQLQGAVSQARLEQGSNQRKHISVLGTILRAISIPSVLGSSYEKCGYHINRILSEPLPGSIGHKGHKIPITAFAPIGMIHHHCIVDYRGCTQKNSPSVKVGNRPEWSLKTGLISSAFEEVNNLCRNSSNVRLYFRSAYHSLCTFTATSPGASFENVMCEDVATSAGSSEQSHIVEALKLVSGSCYLPHPEKEKTGGEDAHFICKDEHAIGVADGVGGWAELGVDSGLFSRELMSNSVDAIREEPRGSIDPKRVLEKAHSNTKGKGSSTACILALTEKALRAVNLGDSGFLVVRGGSTILRSPVQQHDFNFTYQLESGNGADLPSAGQVFSVNVDKGDVIVAGTDGLFDNLYNNEVTAIVVHSERTGLGPQLAAEKIAALARQRSLDKNRQTPFSAAAQEAGYRYYGGKLDDVTVVVSYVVSS